MWLETIILRKAERRLTPYREQASKLDVSIKEEYQAQLPEITQLYQRASHWHGTGRYHYKHKDTSRYSEIDTASVTDVLQGIISANGLRPHHDPWIDSGGETVSLATIRMHARAFARIHATKQSVFQYELGSIKFWLRLYFILLFIWLVTNCWQLRYFIRNTLQTSVSSEVQNWASAIRKPKDGKVIGVFDMFKGDIPTSDIEGNYPMLLGIQVDPDSLIDTVPLTHKVEQRSLRPITLDMITHLEVPLENVAETQAVVKEYRLTIPVIALEFVDMYLADRSLRELALG